MQDSQFRSGAVPRGIAGRHRARASVRALKPDGTFVAVYQERGHARGKVVVTT